MRHTSVLFATLLALWPAHTYATDFLATQPLSFGTLIPLSASGTVALTTGGTLNTGGSAQTVPSGPETAYPGILLFEGTGLPSSPETVILTVLNDPVFLTGSGGTTLRVHDFALLPDTFQVSDGLARRDNIALGAQLTFGALNIRGSYTGMVLVEAASPTIGTVTVQVPISATLFLPLSVAENVPLHFGVLNARGGGTVRFVPPANSRTVVSGNVGLVQGSPVPTIGQFTIKGEPSAAVTVTFPANATLTHQGKTLTLSNFKTYPSTSAPVALNASGQLDVQVGGDLSVDANQPAGTYSGSYTITVDY